MLRIFPLEWPIGWSRARQQAHAKFGRNQRGAALYDAAKFLEDELRRLGAAEIKLATNIRTAAGGERWVKDVVTPGDAGVAVYFRIENQATALACDKWARVSDNVHALALHVEALRGQLRWGVGSIAQAFGGYRALPAMGARKLWHEVLELPHTATRDQVDRRRLELLNKLHPDRPGGDAERAADVNAAYREALELLEREARQ